MSGKNHRTGRGLCQVRIIGLEGIILGNNHRTGGELCQVRINGLEGDYVR